MATDVANVEMAAAWDPASGGKRRYPWGDELPSPERANLDWRWSGVGLGAISGPRIGSQPALTTDL